VYAESKVQVLIAKGRNQSLQGCLPKLLEKVSRLMYVTVWGKV